MMKTYKRKKFLEPSNSLQQRAFFEPTSPTFEVQRKRNNRSQRSLQEQLQRSREGFNFANVAISRPPQNSSSTSNLLQKKDDPSSSTSSNKLINTAPKSTIQRIKSEPIEDSDLSPTELDRKQQLQQEIDSNNSDITEFQESIKDKIRYSFPDLDESIYDRLFYYTRKFILRGEILYNDSQDDFNQLLNRDHRLGISRDKISEFVHYIDSFDLGETVSQISRQTNENKVKEMDLENINLRYISHVDPSKEITKEQGVLSTVAVGKDGNSHAFVYIEYLQGGVRPMTIMTDLRVSRGNVARIRIDDYSSNSILDSLERKPYKRSWFVTPQQITAVLNKAREVQNNIGDYQYTKNGTHVLSSRYNRKKPINCARYNDKLLKVAGLPVVTPIRYYTPYTASTADPYLNKLIRDQAISIKDRAIAKLSPSSPESTPQENN